jgi:hypothetical protein
MTIDEVSQMLIKDMEFDVLSIVDAEKHYISQLEELTISYMDAFGKDGELYFDKTFAYDTKISADIPNNVSKISFDIKTTNNTDLMGLIVPRIGTTQNISVDYKTGKLFFGLFTDSVTYGNQANINLADGIMHEVLIDNTVNKLYVDGVEVATLFGITPGVNPNNEFLSIGGKLNGTSRYYFEGNLYNVKFMSATDEVLYSWLVR